MSVLNMYVIAETSCPKCGLSGRINDHETAKKLGEPQHIITCPVCKGKGKSEQRMPLTTALDLILGSDQNFKRLHHSPYWKPLLEVLE